MKLEGHCIPTEGCCNTKIWVGQATRPPSRNAAWYQLESDVSQILRRKARFNYHHSLESNFRGCDLGGICEQIWQEPSHTRNESVYKVRNRKSNHMRVIIRIYRATRISNHWNNQSDLALPQKLRVCSVGMNEATAEAIQFHSSNTGSAIQAKILVCPKNKIVSLNVLLVGRHIQEGHRIDSGHRKDYSRPKELCVAVELNLFNYTAVDSLGYLVDDHIIGGRVHSHIFDAGRLSSRKFSPLSNTEVADRILGSEPGYDHERKAGL